MIVELEPIIEDIIAEYANKNNTSYSAVINEAIKTVLRREYKQALRNQEK